MSEIFDVVFPGLMMTWVCFISQSAFTDLYEEHKTKTLQRLMVSSATLNHVILSKMIWCCLLSMIAEFLLILVTGIVFGMKWGNPLLLALVIFCVNLPVAGVLSMIFGFARSKKVAEMILPLIIISFAFIGGGMMPYNELPPFLRMLGEWSFIRWAVVAINAVNHAEPILTVLKICASLAAVGTVFIAIGMFMLKRNFESGDMKS
jgi:ABC-2 type transport system permease protein